MVLHLGVMAAVLLAIWIRVTKGAVISQVRSLLDSAVRHVLYVWSRCAGMAPVRVCHSYIYLAQVPGYARLEEREDALRSNLGLRWYCLNLPTFGGH